MPRSLPNRDVKNRLRTVHNARRLLRHWLGLFIAIFGVFNLLPFVAPLAMHSGWTWLGEAIYTVYSLFCHQMAQRSFFLFGSQVMYDADQLPVILTSNLTSDLLSLRAFLGNDVLGWKVAWSDRMVYMYGAIWLVAIVYGWLVRKRPVKRLSIWLFVLLILPMALDGLTHLLSDYSGGLLGGFRYTNTWLAQLVGPSLPEWFYRGDTLGTFNSWMRLISGIGFGVAAVGLLFPIIEREMRIKTRLLDEKLHRFYFREETNPSLEN